MRTLTYVIGAPGVGKSAAVEAAIRLLGWGSPRQEMKPFAHQVYALHDAILLGRQPDNGFPGTDTLSLGVNPKAVAFVGTRPASTIVGEGDRLANRRFLAAAAADYAVALVTIEVPPATAYSRMLERADRLGVRPQTESWWNGRWTKVRNLRRWECPGLEHVAIDGSVDRASVAASLAAVISARSHLA